MDGGWTRRELLFTGWRRLLRAVGEAAAEVEAALTPRRPPGARPEVEFRSLCDGPNGCISCLVVCREEGDALSLSGGYPVLDPDRCTRCGRCVEVCPTGALDPQLWQEGRTP